MTAQTRRNTGGREKITWQMNLGKDPSERLGRL